MKLAHKLLLGAGLLAGAVTTLVLVAREARSARLQAGVLSELARGLGFAVGAGRSDAIRFPGPGPYDQRRGYTSCRLSSSGSPRATTTSPRRRACRRACWRSTSSACSPPIARRTRPASCCWTVVASGYTVSGFRSALTSASTRCRRCSWTRCCSSRTASCWVRAPRGATRPSSGTACERGARSGAPHVRSRSDRRPAAARWPRRSRSTATRRKAAPTRSRDKLRQMASASLRAYLDGEDTLLRRRQIVVDYLNTVPLAAQAGSGEVQWSGRCACGPGTGATSTRSTAC